MKSGREWPSWLKGGVIGGVIGLFLGLFSYLCLNGLHTGDPMGLLVCIPLNPLLLLGLIPSFQYIGAGGIANLVILDLIFFSIFGALIGWIIGKVKERKAKKKAKQQEVQK